MLEFVHLTGAAAGKDLQTRRKVRSQAMRDFRRRQRAEREAANKSGQKQAAAAPIPTPSPRSQQRERAASDSFEVAANKARRIVSSQHDDPSTIMLLGNSYQNPPVIVSPAPSPAIDDHKNFAQIPAKWKHQLRPMALHRTQSETSQRQHHPPRGPSPSIPRSPSQWAVDSEDPFQSPRQVGQMFGFCKSYIQWLRPGVDSEFVAKTLAQVWESSSCPMLLASCCLASVGHLDAVQPNRPSGDYAMYKARVLREVSERMQASETATSDETIGALSQLLSFEMSRGSEEALTHLRGLKSIINLKGGLETLRSGAGTLTMMLECLDLVHAVIFDSQLVLTMPTAGLNETPADDPGISDAEVFARLTPILAAEQSDFHRTNQTASSEKLGQLRNLLVAAQDVLNDVLTEEAASYFTTSDDTAQIFRQHLELFQQSGVQPDPRSPDAHHLARACHLNMVILFHLIVNKVPQRHMNNQSFVNNLFEAVRNVKDATWRPIPYLRLWVLLTGAISSIDVSKKSFFKAQLVRAIYQMGMSEWRRVKTFIMRYLDAKRVLERPSRLSTPLATPSLNLSAPRPSRAGTTGSTPWLFYAESTYGSRAGTPMSRAATDSSMASRSPYMSAITSAPYVENFQLEPPTSQPLVPDSDAGLDPLLQYDDFYSTADTQPHGHTPGQLDATLTSDRTFHNSVYEGNFWFIDPKS